MELEKLVTGILDTEFSTVDELKDILTQCKIDEYEAYAVFNEEEYARIKLYENDQFEVVLICWNPWQSTPFHDHPENGCLFKVLKGNLIEIKQPGNEETKQFLPAGYLAYTVGGASHIIENQEKQAISLHIYSPNGHYD